MQTVFYLVGGLVVLYLLFTLICTYFVQQLPRKPVTDPPDWGRVIDTKIPAVDAVATKAPHNSRTDAISINPLPH